MPCGLAIALTHLGEVRDTLESSDPRTPFVARKLSELEQRVPRLTVVVAASAPAGAAVDCDGARLGPGLLGVAMPVDPGPHECVLHTPGNPDGHVALIMKETERVTVSLTPGAQGLPERTVAPRPVAADSPVVPVVPRLPERSVETPATPTARSRTVPYVLGAVGITGLVVGATTGILAVDAASTYRAHCTPNCDPTGVDAARSGRTMSLAATVGFGLGLASLATAGVVF
jgi:hypothetical protein